MKLIECPHDSGVAVLRTQSNWVIIAPNDVVSFKAKTYALRWLQRQKLELIAMRKIAQGDDIAIMDGNLKSVDWHIKTVEELD